MEVYQQRSNLKWFTLFGLIGVLSVGFLAFSAPSMKKNNSLNIAELQELAERVENNDFPIDVNQKVLFYYNKFLTTKKGRRFVRKSLKRRAKYVEMFHEVFKEFDAPSELLAVSLIESGFRNAPAKDSRVGAAGLWQFMPQTARNFGLRVDDKVDERLHPRKETDVALKALFTYRERFEDWRLSLMAYNAGPRLVQRAIDTLGTRDAWEMIDKGYENDKDYLPKIMAGVLILKNESFFK